MEVLTFAPASTLSGDQQHPDYLVIMQRVPFTASGPGREHLGGKPSETSPSSMTKHSVRDALRQSLRGRVPPVHVRSARHGQRQPGDDVPAARPAFQEGVRQRRSGRLHQVVLAVRRRDAPHIWRKTAASCSTSAAPGRPWQPTRSLYHFELLIALCRQAGFHLRPGILLVQPGQAAFARRVGQRSENPRQGFRRVRVVALKTPWPKADNQKVLQDGQPRQDRLLKRGYRPKARRPATS